MRNTRDRLRHAIGFELIGLLIAAPLASWVTGVGLNHMGPLALFFSVLATVWNYVYNIGVDKLLLKYQGHTHKSLWQRIAHTFGFEGGLLFVALPVMSWWLDISMMEALVLDLGFVLFYLVYAFIYNGATTRCTRSRASGSRTHWVERRQKTAGKTRHHHARGMMVLGEDKPGRPAAAFRLVPSALRSGPLPRPTPASAWPRCRSGTGSAVAGPRPCHPCAGARTDGAAPRR